MNGNLQKYGFCKNRHMFNFFSSLPDETVVIENQNVVRNFNPPSVETTEKT